MGLMGFLGPMRDANFVVVNYVLVYLVGEAQSVELLAESRDKLHLIARVDLSSWIVRIADYDRLCLFIERGAQLVTIEYEAIVRSVERHETRPRAGDDRVRHIVLIIGIKDDRFFTRI